MLKRLLLFFVACFPLFVSAQLLTRYELSGGKETATYEETIEFYRELNRQYRTIAMEAAGPTDTRYPLHVVYFCNDARFDVARWKQEGKLIILINNGIHPGEPDGIEACKMLLREAAMGNIKVPDNVILAVVPVFNIGGALNRGSYSRANQLGPKEYGFRGSAQNLDLNRDFIKVDAKETRTLIDVFHSLDPDIFIDNHVSNGADYQHVMTLLSTQHNKLGGRTGKYLHEVFEPAIYKDMKIAGYDLTPYVNDFSNTPENGWTEFYDYPRFSSGFAALFQTMAFVPETHMLKPFRERVEATYALMQSFIKLAGEHAAQIKEVRARDRETMLDKVTFPLNWQADTSRHEWITFKGYEAGHKKSEVSGLPRLYYDRNRPYTRKVKYYNTFKGSDKIEAPLAYIIPQGWQKAIERLRWNGVEMYRLNSDTAWELNVYKIEKYDSPKGPYEGHYLHRGTTVRKEKQWIKLQKGDYIIPVDQRAKRYIIEVLEPTGPDAFFAWNFFDAILQQKEYFSDYVFEDEAARLLVHDPELRQLLKERQQSDPEFARNAAAQLDFIYRHSPYYEPTHMRYPVYRVE